jgi:hypothetical protein
MMRKQDIEITISPSGQVSFTIKGVKGPDCLSETKFLEDALGGDVIDRQKTSEFYEQSEGTVSTWAGEGKDD